MDITTISSRDFDKNVCESMRAADKGPVFITDRDHPTHVLLTIEHYKKITKNQKSIVDLLGMSELADIEFPPL